MTITCPKCGTEHHTQKAAKLKYVKDSPTEQHVESCVSCRSVIVCSKCALEVPKEDAEEHFDHRHDSPTGFQYACKECRKKQCRKYRTEEYKKQKRKKEREATREKIKKKVKEVPRERDHHKESFNRRLKHIIEKLQKREPLGETVRTFNFSLKVIIEHQLNLMYNGIHTPAGLQKKRQIIADAVFEIQEALSRTADRMKRASNAETPELVIADHTAERAHALGVLGLPLTATMKEIKERHRKLAKTEHPDHGGSASRMAEINRAWSTLEEINGSA